MKPNGFSTTDLNLLQRQLMAWRRRQSGRARLPEALWTVAAALAKTEGVSRVARTLRLDFYRLRRRCRPADARLASPPGGPAFVEVELPPPLTPAERHCRIEVRHPDGRRLMIELDRDPSALLAVVDRFLEHQP